MRAMRVCDSTQRPALIEAVVNLFDERNGGATH